MWIYDLATLAFLAVNDAAIQTYGYSADEFLRMTVLDIRPIKDVQRFLTSCMRPHESTAEEWVHVGKDGVPFAVSITSWELTFQGHKAELVLARKNTL
jgi:PAS domain S-box-containing protein